MICLLLKQTLLQTLARAFGSPHRRRCRENNYSENPIRYFHKFLIVPREARPFALITPRQMPLHSHTVNSVPALVVSWFCKIRQLKAVTDRMHSLDPVRFIGVLFNFRANAGDVIIYG